MFHHEKSKTVFLSINNIFFRFPMIFLKAKQVEIEVRFLTELEYM